MNPTTRNAIVGLVVVGAIGALAWMILKFSSTTVSQMFAKGTAFTLRADRADGLAEGSGIQYLGVNVGRITGMRRLPDDSGVMIDALLNEGEVLPSNLVGYIRAQSALGTGANITLETQDLKTHKPQPPTKERLKAGTELQAFNKNTGIIPAEFTALAEEVKKQELIIHLDETIKRAGAAMDSVDKLIGDPKLKNDLSDAMASFRETNQNLQKFSAKLEGLATHADETITQVRSTTAGAGTRFEEMAKQLGDRMTQLGDLLDKANGIAAKIEKGQGTLGLLVNDPRLYESLVDTGKTLSLTVTDLRRLVEQWEQEGFTLKLK
jgi:phospholipid/cholesterol/gamma-HCH transport system substrate-binding protein